MKHSIFLLAFIAMFSIAEENQRIFFQGLAGIKYQIDEINGKVRVLQNSSPSHQEISHRLHEIDEDIDEVRSLYNNILTSDVIGKLPKREIDEIEKKLASLTIEKIKSSLTPDWKRDDEIIKNESILLSRDYTDKELDIFVGTLIAILTLILGGLSFIFGYINVLQNKRTKEIEEQTNSHISDVVKTHKSDIQRLTDVHHKKISELEKLNLEKIEGARNAFDMLIADADMQNGLIYKNLAVSLYDKRYLVEDNIEDIYIESNHLATKLPKMDVSVLHEIISIQTLALGRFSKVKGKLREAEMLYYESNLDLAFYEIEMTRHGYLKAKAKTTIRDKLKIFIDNIERWIEIEKSKQEEAKHFEKLFFRLVAAQDSVLFIETCLNDTTPESGDNAKQILLDRSNQILLKMGLEYREQIEAALNKLSYDFWWKKYDAIKDEHPYIKRSD